MSNNKSVYRGKIYRGQKRIFERHGFKLEDIVNLYSDQAEQVIEIFLFKDVITREMIDIIIKMMIRDNKKAYDKEQERKSNKREKIKKRKENEQLRKQQADEHRELG